MATKYGIKVSGPDSVTKINAKIRGQMAKARTRDRLLKLVRESLYLYTLTFSPSFQRAIKGKVSSTRVRARTQYTQSARRANKRMAALKLKGRKFDTKIN